MAPQRRSPGSFRLAVFALSPFVLMLALWLAPRVSHACSCMPSPGALPAAQEAAFVFEGTPESVEIRADPPPKGVNPKYATKYKYFQFKVARSWKGEPGETISIKTAMNGAACGINYEVGTPYLVYARNYDGQATTSACSRTRRSDSDQAKEDFVVLDEAEGDFSGKPKDPPPEQDAVGPAEPEPHVDPAGQGGTTEASAPAAPPPTADDGRGCAVAREAPSEAPSKAWWLVVPLAALASRRRGA
jgi:hypothetical protein